MEIFRYTRNAWGQEVLEGVSWELLWVFLGLTVLFIVVHMIYVAVRGSAGNINNKELGS